MRYDMNIFSSGDAALVMPFAPPCPAQDELMAQYWEDEKISYHDEMNFVARLLMWATRNNR